MKKKNKEKEKENRKKKKERGRLRSGRKIRQALGSLRATMT
ncbi:hypothetical protein O5O45_09620 [Hahella aquimaris]|nr:hypothetical protein [Hahella sp. HNIBRBA332]WLQ16172.1 hypothetical protein O5O45_09620 [Hahella sp. HNIBRBA332]